MPRKAYHIGIDVDVHAITCPGVWLCPKGGVMLQVTLLGASGHTQRMEPKFPLLFHEKFHFRKTLTDVTSLMDIQSELAKRFIELRLVQWHVHGCRCVLLATFRGHLTDVLYPRPKTKGAVAGVDVELLMEPTPCFPGIIVPKVEVSTKVVIEEVINYPLDAKGSAAIVNKVKILSSKKKPMKKTEKLETKNKPKSTSGVSTGARIRHQPVCHHRPRGKQRAPRLTKAGRVHDDSDYQESVEDKDVTRGQIVVKENETHNEKWESTCPCAESLHSKPVCECGLCRKYDELFKNTSASSGLSLLPKSSLPKTDPSSSPTKKDKDDGCTSDGCTRARAGATKSECRYVTNSLNNTSSSIGEYISELLGQKPLHDEYREMLKADLDTRYKKLYERVCRRNNRRQI